MLQFVLLLWTAIYVTDEASERWSGSLASARTSNNTSFNMALICMIFLGGTASLYQLWNLRTFTLLSEKHEWHIPWRSVGLTATGAETFQIREAYQHLDRLTSPDAIVQFNPDGDLRLHALGYSRYQQVDAGSPDCAISFGGSLSDCLKVQVPIKRIYDPGSADALSETEVEGLCHTLGISVLVVTSHDPVLKTSGSWIWQSTPIVKNDLVRMYRCSSTP